MASMFKRRKSKGRQKIEIKKIEKEEARQICFSKRKAGIFKKANELAVLCGAEVGIVAFSPAGKAFSFGHPNIHPVIDRYLAAGEASTTQDLYLHHPGTYYVHEAQMRDLQREHEDLVTLVTAVKRQQGEMKKTLWWDDIEGLGVEDLMEYVKVLEQLKMNVVNRIAEKNKGLQGGVVHPGYDADEMRRVDQALNLQPMSSVHPGFGFDDIRGAKGLSLHGSSSVHPGYGSDEMIRRVDQALNLQPMSSSVHPGFGFDELRRAEGLSLHANSFHPGLYPAGVLPAAGCSFGGLDHELSRSVESLHAGVLPGCSFGGLGHEMSRSTVESLHAGFGHGFFNYN